MAKPVSLSSPIVLLKIIHSNEKAYSALEMTECKVIVVMSKHWDNGPITADNINGVSDI